MIKNFTRDIPSATMECNNAFSNLFCLLTVEVCDGSRPILPCLPYCVQFISSCYGYPTAVAEIICSEEDIGNFSSDPDCYCGGSRGPNNVCSTSPDSCPAPAAEQCCTRIMSNPRATFNLNVPHPSAISSITVWNAAPGGSPLLSADASAMQGPMVSVESAYSSTECLLAPSTATKPGFATRRLLCGAAGTTVRLSFAKMLPSAPSGTRLAVRLCLFDESASGAGDDATLWIQQAGGSSGSGSSSSSVSESDSGHPSGSLSGSMPGPPPP
jgi:hypothetical protein